MPRFGEKVVVISEGFYKDAAGIVIDQDELYSNVTDSITAHYNVRFTNPTYGTVDVWFDADQICPIELPKTDAYGNPSRYF